MSIDLSVVSVSTTKPRGKIARMLAEMGIQIVPIDEDEGNVDRYVLSKRLAIERRTGSSFLRGIMEKTLFTSAIALREHFRIPVLIVEGQVDYTYSGFDPQAVRGALSSMMILYGIHVLCTPNAEETAALLAMMARHEQVGIPEISLIPKRKATALADQQRRLIEMLPGCGRVMARELLQTFGSVRRIVNATEDELRAQRGIGARKSREMHKVLAAEYEAVDTERNLEDAIEVEPGLLFDQPVALLARQHYIYTEEGQRQFIDMVFLDPEADELILVELKRGKLARQHEKQLARYLAHAAESRLLGSFLAKGTTLRGLLATVEPCEFKAKARNVTVCIVDRKKTIAVLKLIRDRHLGMLEGSA